MLCEEEYLRSERGLHHVALTDESSACAIALLASIEPERLELLQIASASLDGNMVENRGEEYDRAEKKRVAEGRAGIEEILELLHDRGGDMEV